MKRKKQAIQLTDIAFHSRDFKTTTSFKKAQEKGRFYLNADNLKISNLKTNTDGDVSGNFELELPPDIFNALYKKKVPVLMPSAGIPMVMGKDGIEKLKQLAKKYWNIVIHRGRVWRSDDQV